MRRLLENFPTPPPMRVTTGGEEEVQIADERDRFFADIRKELRADKLNFDGFFSYQSHVLHALDGRPTDSILHSLEYAGIQPVASVLDTRDDMNFHIVVFTAYSLSLHAMRSIFELHSADQTTD